MNFMDKVKSGFTTTSNAIDFLFFEGQIEKYEYLLLRIILVFNFAKKRKVSIKQLSKLTRIHRDTISKNIVLLVEKGLIEIESIGKYIIIQSKIIIENSPKIILKSVEDAEREEKELIESEEIEPDEEIETCTNLGTNMPKFRHTTCTNLGTIELKNRNKNIKDNNIVIATQPEPTKNEVQETKRATDVTRNKKAKSSYELKAGEQVRRAYIDAYFQKYGIDPINTNCAKARAIFKSIVDQIGLDNAVGLCYAYLENNDPYFKKMAHPYGLLLSSMSKIHKEAITGQSYTGNYKDDIDARNKEKIDSFLKGESDGFKYF